MQFISWANGYKTYLCVAAGLIDGVLTASGHPLPGWANIVLVCLGGAALRHSVSTETQTLAATIISTG